MGITSIIFPHCDNSFLVISDTCLTDRRRMQCHELLGNGQSCIAKNSRRTKPRSLGRPVSKRRGNKQSAMHSATSQSVDLNFQKSMLEMYTVAEYSWFIANNFVIGFYCRCLEILCQIAFSSIANYFRFYRKKQFGIESVGIYSRNL